jgi:hypothetical protein
MPVVLKDRDLNGVLVNLRPAVDVPVRITMLENDSAPAEPARIRVSLIAAESGGVDVNGRNDPNGTIVFPQVRDGRYTFTALSLGPGLHLSDIRQGGVSLFKDAAVTIGPEPPLALEMVLSRNGGTIQGSVGPANSAGAAVLIVPQAPNRKNPSLYRRIGVGPDGVFTATNLPPGEYKLFAFDLDSIPDNGAEQNAEFIARFEARGVRASVRAGGTVAPPRLNLITDNSR